MTPLPLTYIVTIVYRTDTGLLAQVDVMVTDEPSEHLATIRACANFVDWRTDGEQWDPEYDVTSVRASRTLTVNTNRTSNGSE